MLKKLRTQLTFIYLLAAVGLAALISLSAYTLLNYYLQQETDLALKYKMAIAFRQYGLNLPPELVQAERVWVESKPPRYSQPSIAPLTPSASITTTAGPLATKTLWTPVPVDTQENNNASENNNAQDNANERNHDKDKSAENENERENENGDEDSGSRDHIIDAHYIEQLLAATEEPTEPPEEEIFDSQLASIYVLPVDASGAVIGDANLILPPFSLETEASKAALAYGSDLRTIYSPDGSRIRLLTYRLDQVKGPALLQMGRTLTDQDRLRTQFLIGMLTLGALSVVMLGMGSWWLSGKTLMPAQKSWDQQQIFISNASHELRTPLTLIRATAEVIQRSQSLNEEQNQLIGDILSECDYVDRLVNDLLLLSRLDTHRLNLVREPVNLKDLLSEALELTEKMLNGKNIAIQIGNAQGEVLGDQQRLRQVLLILLDNAIRYTPDGGSIFLTTIQKHKTWQVIVQDSGIGISPEHLPHVFDRFYQVNPASDETSRSNGLGLSIAKGLINALGGEITAQSQPGRGARFIVELPAVHK